MTLRLSVPIDVWDPRRGGAERYLDRLCRDLCGRGHQVTVLCLETTEAEESLPVGMTIERLEVCRFPRWRRELAFARRSVRAHTASGRNLLFAVRHALEADVYQPHGGSFRAARRGALRHLPPVIQVARGVVAGCRPAIRVLLWLDREVFRRSPGLTVVSISAKVEEDFRAIYPDLRARFRRLYHGVDTRHFHDRDRDVRRAETRRRYDLPDTAPLAVFLAHRFRPKGLRHALRALSRAGRWHLLVAGRDCPRPFRRLAKRLRVDRRVRFAGSVPDSRALLAGADALILPTYYDACSLVVLEALACGTPVVTTRESGSAELMHSGKHGFVLERPDQERELAEALNRIARDWETFHEAALSLREKIGWEAHLERMEGILMEALEEKRRRADCT